MKRVFFLFLIIQGLLTLPVFSQQPILFNGENKIIGESISILEDSTNKLDVEVVAISPKFVPSNVQTPNLKLSKSDYWLRFSIKNNSSFNHFLLMSENPTLDKCELYVKDNGVYKVQKINTTQSFNIRKYKHQNPIFDIFLPKDSTQIYYLCVRSNEQMVLPLIIGSPQNIAESLLNNGLVWGILIGLLFVMILYNLFIFISTRDRSYLYYVLYITFIALTQTSLSGYTYRFIISNSPELYNKVLIVFPGMAGIFAVLFVKSFLNTKEKTPILNKFFPVIISLYSIAIFLRIFGFDIISYRMIDIAALSITILIFSIAGKISLQGYKPAKYFLIAWTMFLLGLILFVLRNLGILPYHYLTNYTMQIGTAFEATLLSLALANRINILKKEKEISQAEALAAAKENERIITEQNIILEQKVEKRTEELVKANVELGDTLEDLKQAQSQLVESEKMASLGQLTAGIAHEINNPINFVTSNVPPLQRDVDMLFNAIEFIENIGLSEKGVQDKQQSIDDYKEELDYDYLKTEIKHLLNGITEGASRTAEIVRGLRIFSRVDEDDLKSANINEGLDSTLTIMKNSLALNGIKVQTHFGKFPNIECYPGKLNQVFLNIISNSIDALKSKTDGQRLIQISTESDGKNAIIKISDNGIGMDEVTKQKIFEPFFTTKEVGEGTGLGMSIVYNTIKKHFGEVHVNSELNKGTETIIIIPVSHEKS